MTVVIADSPRLNSLNLIEGHEPDALADLRDADVLPGKDVAEIELSALATRDRPASTVAWRT